MDDGYQVDAVYTDFSKAFDKVHHPTLVYKLQIISVHGRLLRLLDSYLYNRKQCVRINNCTSEYVSVSSGVPQGPHLGPFLFSLSINDISSCFQNSGFSLYADDLKLSIRVASLNDCFLLQEDINRMFNYCCINKLVINFEKWEITFSRSKTIVNFVYGLDSNIIKQVVTIKDLGIVLDSKLSFDVHVVYIVKKAYRNVGFLNRVTRNFTSKACMLALYNSLVRSHLEYGCVMYCILRIQMKCINMMNWIETKFFC